MRNHCECVCNSVSVYLSVCVCAGQCTLQRARKEGRKGINGAAAAPATHSKKIARNISKEKKQQQKELRHIYDMHVCVGVCVSV